MSLSGLVGEYLNSRKEELVGRPTLVAARSRWLSVVKYSLMIYKVHSTADNGMIKFFTTIGNMEGVNDKYKGAGVCGTII